MVSHILGLNAYAQGIFEMERPYGLKKVCYTHLDLPMVAIDDLRHWARPIPSLPAWRRLPTPTADYGAKRRRIIF
jgi:hypothetical protein